MSPEQVVAVVVLASAWFAADGYSRRLRRRVEHARRRPVQRVREQQQVVRAGALPADD